MLFALLSALLLQPASPPPQAPHVAPACTETDGTLPANLLAWRNPVDQERQLVPGRAVTLALHPLSEMETIGPPRNHWQGPSTGIVLSFDVETAGTYAIALDIPAWIELIWHRGDRMNSHRVDSASHGHGPPCSTIRKIVDFQLEPGNYTLQISGTNAASARLLIVRR